MGPLTAYCGRLYKKAALKNFYKAPLRLSKGPHAALERSSKEGTYRRRPFTEKCRKQYKYEYKYKFILL